MQIDTRLGQFDDIIAAAPEHADILRAVRTLVEALHPPAYEVASRKEISVWWGWGDGKMKQGYAYVMPHKTHVNLGFFQGIDLPDPEHLLEGSGKNLRHVKLKNQAEVARPAIRALLAAARDERKAALKL
ncbi:MAG: DUF1801 domain-containing protein [Rhizobiaceae bacterium]